MIAHIVRAQFLEEAGEEIPCVIDQDVDAAEPRDGGFDCRVRLLEAGDVEPEGQQTVVIAERRRDFRRIATGGNNGVTGSQGSLGNVDTQASPSPR